ncbi:MAG: hypothetical protein GX595_10500 [Lentisphaerae bacterium]|nr:hypothetical protein [Lentisphaerota bacterium]
MRQHLRMGMAAMLTALATAAQPTAVVPVDEEISVGEVLRLVDTAQPALAGVGEAIQAGRQDEAVARLAEHFARRTTPVLPPAVFPGVGEGNSMTVIRPRDDRQQADTTWMRHRFSLRNNDAGTVETYDLGESFEWMHNPSEALSWVLYLNQLNHLAGLAGLYQSTRDEAYATEVAASIESWVRQCPRWYGYTNKGTLTPSPMEVRNRLCNIVAAYDILRASPSLTPARHLAFWKFIIAACRELCTYNGVSYPGLIPAAVMFPEFTENAEWMRAGEANLRLSLEQRTSPEGAWDTHSISYQTVSVPWSARVLEFLRANPGHAQTEAMADMVTTQIGKLLGLMLWLAMPNGGLPNIGDTYGRCDWSPAVLAPKVTSFIASQFPPDEQERLNAIPDVFTRALASLASAGGETAPAPAEASMAFPGSGYYVMRSGWEPKQAAYLYYDLTPQSLGHAHSDASHIEFYAYGKPLLTDTGDYFLGWGYRTALHNAIEVDGAQQERGPKAPMLPCDWVSTPAFDLVDGAHGAFADRGVMQRRKALFIKTGYVVLCDLLAAHDEHTYEQFFHVAGPTQQAGAMAVIDPATLAARSDHPGVANVMVIPAGTDGLQASFAEAQDSTMPIEEKFERKAMLGWIVTTGTFQRARSAVAVYQRQGRGPQAFHDVLFPVPAHGQAEVTVEALPVRRGEAAEAAFQAAGMVVRATVHTPAHDPAALQPSFGTNLAAGRPAFAEVNQGSIPADSPLLTDGDPAAQSIPGGVSSSPHAPGVALEGGFGVDLGEDHEVNAVRLHHGIWNGQGIIYPPDRMAVQTWNGTAWEDVAEPVTTWHDGEVSLTVFKPVRTRRVRVAVGRAAGGRIGAREIEVSRIPDAELARLEQARQERLTETWTDTILMAHQEPALRQFGGLHFDGEMALLRHDDEGRLRQICLKGGRELRDGERVLVAVPTALDYLVLTWQDDAIVIDAPVQPNGLRVSAAGARRLLAGDVTLPGEAERRRQAGDVALPTAVDGDHLVLPATTTAAPRLEGVRVEILPAQAGMAGAQPSAVITWTTDLPATSQVAFNEPGVGQRRTILDRTLRTEHRVQAWFLRPGQEYAFVAESVSAHGQRGQAQTE